MEEHVLSTRAQPEADDADAACSEAQRHAWLDGVDTAHHAQRDALLRNQQTVARILSELRLISNTLGLALDGERRMRGGGRWPVPDPARGRAQAQAGAGLRRSHRELADRLQEVEAAVSRSFVHTNALCEELERVRLLSLTDEFTGLPNRRAFHQKLDSELSRARRHGSHIALAMIDLDHFKTVNDAHGHAAGDTVLYCYANRVLAEVRQHDVVARYGGEEFAIVFPDTGEAGALRALKKLRVVAAGTSCEIAAGTSIALPSFSAGLTVSDGDEAVDGLLDRADRALYRAKRRGRNRVEIETRTARPGSAML